MAVRKLAGIKVAESPTPAGGMVKTIGLVGPPSDHRRAIERKNAHTVEGVKVSKEVHGENVGSARLRIIPQREPGGIA